MTALGELARWVQSVPLFPIILGAGVIFTVVFSAAIAKWLKVPVWVTAGLLIGLSLVLAATWSPAASGVSGPCLRSIQPPVDPRDLISRSDNAMNTWLFVPLGFFAALASFRRSWIILVAFAMPFVVEFGQRILPVLDRRCQFQDLVDNTWGLILGAAAGLVVGFAVGLWRRDNEPEQPTPEVR